MSTTELYEKSEPLIHQICTDFHRRWRIEFDELKGLANLIFMDAVERHESSRGEFSTLLVRMLNTRLLSEVRRERLRKTNRDTLAKEVQCPSTTGFIDLLCDMGEDAKTIIQIVVEPPPDIRAEPRRGHRFFRGAVKRHLRNQRGWSFYRIQKALSEVKYAIRSSLSA